MSPREVVRWLQGLLGPINRLPSWLNELLSGFLCVGIAWAILAPFGRAAFVFPLAFALSEAYERLLDPWGYNPQDVVERVRGIVLLLLVWFVVRA